MTTVDYAAYLDEKGNIAIGDGETLVSHMERQEAENADALAYRFIDYNADVNGLPIELTWRELGTRTRAVAARLQQVTQPGDRIAILCSQSLDYVVAFYAALLAGDIAVPLYAPDDPYPTERLHKVIADCRPSTVLTSSASAAAVREFFADKPHSERPRVILVDQVPDSMRDSYQLVSPKLDDVAYLQYTSGSTRIPAGVEITYEAIAANVLQISEAMTIGPESRGVTWLPMFHDMGLVTIILPAVGGRYITIMTPAAFVRRPGRWIKELAAAKDGAGTFAAAPNFAFEHAALRGLPKEGEDLDLSNVIGLINGSEPVTVSSMRKFNEAFAPYGLPKTAIKPCYGMAEATLFVSATKQENQALVTYVDREELGQGRFVVVDESHAKAVPQVSTGQVSMGQWAAIVDPEAGAEVADGTVGEIWLHGANIGVGYYGREQETRDTFHNTFARLPEGSHAAGADSDAKWMRTGDLGVWLNGELYITGRVKDLIIVDGRNHYPQDIEATAEEASPIVRPNFVAAFSVPTNQLPAEVFAQKFTSLEYDPEDASEQLVVVAERQSARKGDPVEVAAAVRAHVAAVHGVMVRDLLLVPAGSIPRTSSGKIAHRACQAAYIDGSLRGGYQQTAYPDTVDA